jgi:SAM-dependent methyltransferase
MIERAWPRTPPPLSDEQKRAREKFMMLWHEQLPRRYFLVENFNHGYVAKLPIKAGSKTLEIGAGLGEHARFEDLTKQDYYLLEYRKEFCEKLSQNYSKDHVIHASIQDRQPQFTDQSFDRIVAIHVLEHLPDLPKALVEIKRLLKDDGVFDVVLPCEGLPLYSFARKLSSERLFRKSFRMDFTPIIQNEHLSTLREIMATLMPHFVIERRRWFPFSFLPQSAANLIVGMRLRKII